MSTNSDDKIKRLESLDGREMGVLTFIMADKDIKIIEIAKRMNLGESTTRNILTRVYTKLRVPDSERDKRGYLIREYLEVYTERFLKPQGVQGSTDLMRVLDKRMPAKNTPPVSRQDDEPLYQLPSGYVEDARDRTSDSEDPVITVTPENQRLNPKANKTVMVVGLVVIAVVAIAFLSNVLRAFNAPSQSAYVPDTTIPTSVPVVQPTSVAQIIPTTAPVVATQAPVVPISAPKAFYNQGESASIRDGIYITLGQNFEGASFSGCSSNPGFVVKYVVNNKTNNQFVARYESSTFSAVDDTGKTYSLVGSGVGYCENSGPMSFSMNSGEWPLVVSFAGQIPVNARYIEITIQDISGSGKIVFRKTL